MAMLHASDVEPAPPPAGDMERQLAPTALWAEVSSLLDSLLLVIGQPPPDVVLDSADDTDALISPGSNDKIKVSSPRQTSRKDLELKVRETAVQLQSFFHVLRESDESLFEEANAASLALKALDDRIVSATDELARQKEEFASGSAEEDSLCAELDSRGQTLDASLKFQATLQRRALQMQAEAVAAARRRHTALGLELSEDTLLSRTLGKAAHPKSARLSPKSSAGRSLTSDSSTLPPQSSARTTHLDSGRYVQADTLDIVPVVRAPEHQIVDFEMVSPTDAVEQAVTPSLTPMPSQFLRFHSPAEEDVAAIVAGAEAAVRDMRPRMRRSPALAPPPSLVLPGNPPPCRFASQRLSSPPPLRRALSAEGRDASKGSPTRKQVLEHSSVIAPIVVAPFRSCGSVVSSPVGLIVEGAVVRLGLADSRAGSMVGSAAVRSCASGSPTISPVASLTLPVGLAQEPRRRGVSRDPPMRSASPSPSRHSSPRSQEGKKTQDRAVQIQRMPMGSAALHTAEVRGSSTGSSATIGNCGHATSQRPVSPSSQRPNVAQPWPACNTILSSSRVPPAWKQTGSVLAPTGVGAVHRNIARSQSGYQVVQPAPPRVHSPPQTLRRRPLSITVPSTSSSHQCLPVRPSSRTATTLVLRESSRGGSASPDASATKPPTTLLAQRTSNSPATVKTSRVSPRTLRSPPRTTNVSPRPRPKTTSRFTDASQREGSSLSSSLQSLHGGQPLGAIMRLGNPGPAAKRQPFVAVGLR